MLWLLACAGETRVTLDVPVWAGGTGAAPDGVTLNEATVTFADLRLEEPRAVAWSWSPIAQAYAHPGHDSPGDVAGELLGEFTVDLLARDAELGVAPCYTGEYATGRVALRSVVLAGEHDGAPFRFEVDAEQEIVGIPFDVNFDAEDPPAGVSVRFDPVAALSYMVWGEPETWDNTAEFGVVATPTWSLEVTP